MALISCPECGREVGNTAKVCVNCGYKIRHHHSISKKSVGIIVLASILILVACFSAIQKNRIDQERERALTAGREASEKADELYALSTEYIRLGREVEAGADSKGDFLAIQYDILDFLKLSHDMVDLTGVNDDILQAIQAKYDEYIELAVRAADISKENSAKSLN